MASPPLPPTYYHSFISSQLPPPFTNSFYYALSPLPVPSPSPGSPVPKNFPFLSSQSSAVHSRPCPAVPGLPVLAALSLPSHCHCCVPLPPAPLPGCHQFHKLQSFIWLPPFALEFALEFALAIHNAFIIIAQKRASKPPRAFHSHSSRQLNAGTTLNNTKLQSAASFPVHFWPDHTKEEKIGKKLRRS
jgi:hypothetical protein